MKLTAFISDAGRHWGQEEKGMTEDEMVGRSEEHTSELQSQW